MQKCTIGGVEFFLGSQEDGNMTGRKNIAASLEGMRVFVDESYCDLWECAFRQTNGFRRTALPRPSPRTAGLESGGSLRGPARCRDRQTSR